MGDDQIQGAGNKSLGKWRSMVLAFISGLGRITSEIKYYERLYLFKKEAVYSAALLWPE